MPDFGVEKYTRQTLLAFCALISCVVDAAVEEICAKDEAT